MAGVDELDNEALLAQIEKEFEEAEKKKKEAKRAKKKGGKGGDEAEESQQKPNDEAGKGDSDQVKENKQPAGHKKPDKKQKGKKKEGAGAEDKETKEDDETTDVTPKPAQEAKEGDKKKKKGGEQKPAAPKAAETKKPEVAETDASRPESAATEKEEPSGKDKKGAKAKKPSGALKQMKEALAKAQAIEDEIRRQEDEKERKIEEERQRQLEKERIEKERKEKKKQKEKERKEKLKQEGKYLTNKQKEQQKRAIIQLEALGIQVKKVDLTEDQGEVPADQQKKPKFERKRKEKQENQTEEQAKENELKEESAQQNEQNELVSKEPKVKENWFDESEEETEEQAAQTAQKQQSNHQHRTQSMTSEEASDSEDDDSDEDESSGESGEEEDESDDDSLPPHERVKKRLLKRHENAEKHRSTDHLRAPVICVLGHVDTGKTKILDNLRKTRVQEDEAGGITQQIGATNVPLETITERTKMCTYVFKNEIKVPGLLIIDTPGHESFKSLRTRGSSLCDIAILVVDIMHGLEPQTIESINILKNGKTPFLIALNKIDRLFEWKNNPHLDIQEALKKQQANTRLEFEKRTTEIITQIAEQGLNARLFYENPDPRTYISIVPTSAHSSDGTGNLIALIIEFSQTILAKKIAFSNEIQCSVMEVKVIPSLGTTIDVCLVNGRLRVADKIIVPGQEGPIETQIRGLLMPQPNRELRVKNSYVTHKEVKGARGIKIAARGLEKAMPGLPLFVAKKEDEIEYYRQEIEGMLKQALSNIHLSDHGVVVQASTLGSLEALLEFLRTSKVPYSGIGIGPIHKKDVTKASIMLEKDAQWAVILAFDVKVERDAQELADNLGIRIFTADIIYHLFDKFIGYREELKRKKREEFKDIAIFPCKLKILPDYIFNTRDPIVVGVKVEAGFIKIGTPLVAICEDTTIERETKDKFVDIGRITSIEFNHKQMDVAKTGNEVCIKIENTTGGAPKLLGRHFSEKDILASKISRESIDAVKEYFREEMAKSDWQLIIDLKKQFNIL